VRKVESKKRKKIFCYLFTFAAVTFGFFRVVDHDCSVSCHVSASDEHLLALQLVVEIRSALIHSTGHRT
jgi:hypothetical protein